MKAFLLFLAERLPAGFRAQFGADVEEQIERDFEVAVYRGLPATLTFTLLTAADLIRVGVAERFNTSWAGARVDYDDGKRGGEMLAMAPVSATSMEKPLIATRAVRPM